MKKLFYISIIIILFSSCKKYDVEPECKESFNTYTYIQNFSFIAQQNGCVTLYNVYNTNSSTFIVRFPLGQNNNLQQRSCVNDTAMLNIFKGDSIIIGYNASYNDTIKGSYDLKYICN